MFWTFVLGLLIYGTALYCAIWFYTYLASGDAFTEDVKKSTAKFMVVSAILILIGLIAIPKYDAYIKDNYPELSPSATENLDNQKTDPSQEPLYETFCEFPNITAAEDQQTQ